MLLSFNMKKKLLITIGVITSLVLLLGVSHLINSYLLSSEKSSGTITFILKDQSNILINDDLEYDENQTLWDLLNENYEVVRDERFEYFIIGINEYIIDDSSYIAIYINDSYALKGANELYLKDQDIVELRFEKFWGE